MNRKEFGKLISALRREHLDKNGKPWNRQRFTEECNKVSAADAIIDEELLTNIENGRKSNLSPDLLVVIASALKLTSGERREFFLAASGVNESSIYRQYDNTQKTLANLISIMERIQGPAFISDQYWDIVAINQALLEIYNAEMENLSNSNANPLTRFNMMRLLFSPEFEEQKELLKDGWEKFAINTAMLFRTSTLRYRATKYFQILYPQLCEFEDFNNFVRYQLKPMDDYFIDNMYITLNNPRYGLMKTISTSLTAGTPSGELALSTFNPLDKETVKIFASICKRGNDVYTILPNWPDKSQE